MFRPARWLIVFAALLPAFHLPQADQRKIPWDDYLLLALGRFLPRVDYQKFPSLPRELIEGQLSRADFHLPGPAPKGCSLLGIRGEKLIFFCGKEKEELFPFSVTYEFSKADKCGTRGHRHPPDCVSVGVNQAAGGDLAAYLAIEPLPGELLLQLPAERRAELGEMFNYLEVRTEEHVFAVKRLMKNPAEKYFQADSVRGNSFLLNPSEIQAIVPYTLIPHNYLVLGRLLMTPADGGTEPYVLFTRIDEKGTPPVNVFWLEKGEEPRFRMMERSSIKTVLVRYTPNSRYARQSWASDWRMTGVEGYLPALRPD